MLLHFPLAGSIAIGKSENNRIFIPVSPSLFLPKFLRDFPPFSLKDFTRMCLYSQIHGVLLIRSSSSNFREVVWNFSVSVCPFLVRDRLVQGLLLPLCWIFFANGPLVGEGQLSLECFLPAPLFLFGF